MDSNDDSQGTALLTGTGVTHGCVRPATFFASYLTVDIGREHVEGARELRGRLERSRRHPSPVVIHGHVEGERVKDRECGRLEGHGH